MFKIVILIYHRHRPADLITCLCSEEPATRPCSQSLQFSSHPNALRFISKPTWYLASFPVTIQIIRDHKLIRANVTLFFLHVHMAAIFALLRKWMWKLWRRYFLKQHLTRVEFCRRMSVRICTDLCKFISGETVSINLKAFQCSESCVLNVLNRQTTKKKQADKHTRKETTKIIKENRRKDTNGNTQSVTTWGKAGK
jgi:hypothetical protein